MTGTPAIRFVAPDYAARVKPRDATWQHEQFRQMPGLIPTADRPRRVVVTGFTRWGFWAKAKVYQWDYFAAFCRKLAELDIDTLFVWDEDGFDAAVSGEDTAVMHLFNEEKHWPYTRRIHDIEKRAGFVFGTYRAASIIANKRVTNLYLSSQGIPMPRLITGPQAQCATFSNAQSGSGKRIAVADAGRALDPDRYNTEFIDTRVSFRGETYFTMFRIQAIGQSVQHAYVRARNTNERAASVHSQDTPADGPLLEHLYDILVRPRKDEIADFTRRVGAALGPGAYAHDLVVCNSTGRMVMVESGFKFNDSPYAEYLEPARHETPSNRCFYDGSYPIRAAELFVREWDRARRAPQPDPSLRIDIDGLEMAA